jgi:hypothetical protein
MFSLPLTAMTYEAPTVTKGSGTRYGSSFHAALVTRTQNRAT